MATEAGTGRGRSGAGGGERAVLAALLLAAGFSSATAEAFRALPATPPSGFEQSVTDSLAAAARQAGLDPPVIADPALAAFPIALDAPSVESPSASVEAAKPKTFWIGTVTVLTVVGSGLNSFTDGPNQRFHFLDEGFFSENTYAGGADKSSHFASYYIVSQLLGDVYEGLGMTRDNAQLLSAGVSAFAGFVTELGDGRGHYGFSYEDFVFDVLSAATYLGIHHYGLDDLVGFSIGPIPAQRRPPGCCETPDFGTGVPRYYNFGQDYSTTISSGNFKIAGLQRHTGLNPGLARFFLVSLTYTSKGYRYYADRDLTQRQIGLFVGINFVQILKEVGVPDDRLWGKVLYFLFDVIRIPYTQIGYVYDLNHSRWHGPTMGAYPGGY